MLKIDDARAAVMFGVRFLKMFSLNSPRLADFDELFQSGKPVSPEPSHDTEGLVTRLQQAYFHKRKAIHCEFLICMQLL